MRLLTNSSVYLCGQVEHDPTAAVWRKQLTGHLSQIIEGVKVWDPLVHPDWFPAHAKEEICYGYKKYLWGNDYDQAKAKACLRGNREIRKICKMLASKCDFMIARISKSFTWGSIDELEIAIERNIPIFLWLPDGIISVYGVAGCVTNESLIPHYIHEDMLSLVNTIRSVHEGSLDLHELDRDRWLYLNWKNAAED